MPGGGIESIRPHLRVVAHPLATEPIRVCSEAAIVRIVAPSAAALTQTERLAVVGVAALTTGHQPLQQVTRTAEALASMAAIGLQLLLNSCEQGGIDQRRHSDGQPRLRWRISRGGRVARLQRTTALGS